MKLTNELGKDGRGKVGEKKMTYNIKNLNSIFKWIYNEKKTIALNTNNYELVSFSKKDKTHI